MLRWGRDSSIFAGDGEERSSEGQRYVTAGTKFKSGHTFEQRIQRGWKRFEIRARRIVLRAAAAEPAQKSDRRREGRIPIGQSFDLKIRARQERADLRSRVATIHIHRTIVCAFQKIEGG